MTSTERIEEKMSERRKQRAIGGREEEKGRWKSRALRIERKTEEGRSERRKQSDRRKGGERGSGEDHYIASSKERRKRKGR